MNINIEIKELLKNIIEIQKITNEGSTYKITKIEEINKTSIKIFIEIKDIEGELRYNTITLNTTQEKMTKQKQLEDLKKSSEQIKLNEHSFSSRTFKKLDWLVDIIFETYGEYIKNDGHTLTIELLNLKDDNKWTKIKLTLIHKQGETLTITPKIKVGQSSESVFKSIKWADIPQIIPDENKLPSEIISFNELHVEILKYADNFYIVREYKIISVNNKEGSLIVELTIKWNGLSKTFPYKTVSNYKKI